MRIVTFSIVVLFFATTSFASPSKTLWRSSRHGYVISAILAIDEGADVNFFAKDGTTPLWQAAMNGHDLIVMHLLKSGADSYIKPRCTNERQIEKEKIRRADSFPHFLKPDYCPQITASGHDKSTATQEARVKLAAATKLSPYEVGTPLHAAIRQGHSRVVSMLIRFGHSKQLTTPDPYGCNPLHLACASALPEIFDAVVEAPDGVKRQRHTNALRKARGQIDYLGDTPSNLAKLQGGDEALRRVRALLK